MKPYIKILSIIAWFMLLWWIVYASVTVARTSWVNKLPYNGAGWVYSSAHNRWPANAWDVARFSCSSGTCPWTTGVVQDTRTWLYWQSSPWSTTYTWANALTQCANLSLWWFTDWRLPDINELESIVDYSYSASNYWYESMFTLGYNLYWSSTTNARYTTSAHVLGFTHASTFNYDKTNIFPVICTR